MAFRFQKRIKLLPGVTLNLSKKGVSTSVGVTGARVTLGHDQTRTTIGLPGTGISHTEIKTGIKPPDAPMSGHPAAEDETKNLVIGIAFILALFAIGGLLSQCTG